MPRPLFDDLIHEPSRLQICGLLAMSVEADFGTVRDEVNLSDSALSKHLKALESAGYLVSRRATDGARSRRVVGLTEAGRHAFCGHVAMLQRLASVASVRGRNAATGAPVSRPRRVTIGPRPA